MRRPLAILVLLALMAGFAFGVNRFFASRKTTIASAAAPTQVHTEINVPGTLYVAQRGNIYRLSDGVFTDLHLPASTGTWMQPAIVPGTSDIVAVARTAAYSDLYLIDGSSGRILRQLSHNKTATVTIQLWHWMFWPRVAADGNTVFVIYDAPKSGQSYEIDFAVWSGSLSRQPATKQWTQPYSYTGGDVEPVPLPNGKLLYAKYQITGGNVFSQLALQTDALGDVVYLTSPTADCAQPAVSPDGGTLAMICASGTGLQSTSLVVAPLQGTKLGTARVLAGNCICAAPAWAADGSGLGYLAPADATGHFQLWWIAGAATATPAAAKAVTSGLDLDATSPPAWSP
jgi:Tol biopolymer transport system component